MNRVLIGVGAVLVLLVAILAVKSGGDAEAEANSAPEVASGDARSAEFDKLEARVETLEREVSLLRGKLLAPRRVSGEGRAALPKGEGQGDGVAAGGPVADSVLGGDDPDVREEVQTMIRDEMDIAREDRWQERLVVMRERMAKRVAKFGEEAKLDSSQEKKLTDILTNEREQVMDAFREGRKTFDFDGARKKAVDFRAETDKKVGDFLERDQLDMFLEDRAEERERWNRRGRRR